MERRAVAEAEVEAFGAGLTVALKLVRMAGSYEEAIEVLRKVIDREVVIHEARDPDPGGSRSP